MKIFLCPLVEGFYAVVIIHVVNVCVDSGVFLFFERSLILPIVMTELWWHCMGGEFELSVCGVFILCVVSCIDYCSQFQSSVAVFAAVNDVMKSR